MSCHVYGESKNEEVWGGGAYIMGLLVYANENYLRSCKNSDRGHSMPYKDPVLASIITGEKSQPCV